MAVEVGSAYVSILPDLSRLPGMIRTGVTTAGNDAGRIIEGEIVDAATRAGQAVGTEIDHGARSAETSIAGLAASIGGIAAIAGGIGQAMTESLNAHKLEAALGLSAADAQAAGQVAARVYGSAWGESLDEVSGTVGAVTQQLGTMGQADLETITTKALAFKGAFGQETPDLIRAVSQMIRTGLVPDAQSAFDVLAVGFQNGSNKADDLIDTFNEYGTQFRKLGIDGPAAMGLITQAIQAGARDSDLAADALKEFSIRAVDGSKTSADAFKLLGLDAEKMTNQIAQGGPKAQAGLALVLDKLRGIKDPATQAAAATGLFGTQAEDLGAALFAMNPSTAGAAKGMADMAGAGDRVTASMSAATDPMETFKRQGMQALADATKGAVPIISGFMGLFGPFIPQLVQAGLAIGGVVAAYKGFQAVQAVIATVKAMEIATKATTVAQVAQATWTKVVTAAQWLWNAAMTANPIGIVVVAIGLLVAAIVIAYKNSETFRKIVQAAWEGIKTAAVAVWNGFLKPIFDAFVVAGKAVGDAALWLWQKAILPAWNGIKAAIDVAWSVIKGIFSLYEWWFKTVLAPVAIFLWNTIKTVWSGISTAIDVAWIIIKAIFNLIRIAIEVTLGPIFRAFGALISLVWNGIKTAIQTAWNFIYGSILQPAGTFIRTVFTAYWTALSTAITTIWNAIKTAVNAAWTWVRDTVLKPLGTYITVTVVGWWNDMKAKISSAWEAVKTAVSNTWNAIKSAVFTPLQTLITQTIPNAFSTGTAAIGRAWDKVQELAKKPVTFVVNSVINPLVRGYNSIVDKFGGDKIPEIKGFATGGSVWGAGTSTSDSIPALLSRGEHVWTAAEVKAAGGHGVVETMRQLAKRGALPAFADGGIVEWVKDPIGAAKSAIGGSLSRLSEIGNTAFGRMIAGMPRKLFDLAVEKAKGLWKKWFSTSGGGGSFGDWPSSPAASRGDSGVWRQIVELIKSTGPMSGSFGNGYRAGDPLWHGSGRAVDWMGFNQDGLAQFLAARKPLELIHRTNARDYAYTRGKDKGSFNESLMQAHRNHIHIAFDEGGWLPQGTQLVTHRPRQPDAVLTADQWRDMRSLAGAARAAVGEGTGKTEINVYPQRADFTVQDLEALQDRQNALSRVGRPR